MNVAPVVLCTDSRNEMIGGRPRLGQKLKRYSGLRQVDFAGFGEGAAGERGLWAVRAGFGCRVGSDRL